MSLIICLFILDVGTTIWSPLASGILTGKYNDVIPDGSRAANTGYAWLQKQISDWQADGKIDKVKELTAYAQRRFGCSVGQLAIAWCIKNKNVSTVLLGATKPEQLTENLGAISVAKRMTAIDLADIDNILKNKPPRYLGYGGSGMRTLEKMGEFDL
jgi:aryl-alcohol dehydrogenase-like predicted oxidoreductase